MPSVPPVKYTVWNIDTSVTCIIPHQDGGVGCTMAEMEKRNECTARGSVGDLEVVRRQALKGLDRGLNGA